MECIRGFAALFSHSITLFQAEELIRRRLEVTPDDAKLWNALGDLHMDDSHYEEAWTRSGGRNARSKRSLGRSAIRRKVLREVGLQITLHMTFMSHVHLPPLALSFSQDFKSAAEHFEAAVALNPLHTESWFSLGYAYVKIEQAEQALRVRVS